MKRLLMSLTVLTAGSALAVPPDCVGENWCPAVEAINCCLEWSTPCWRCCEYKEEACNEICWDNYQVCGLGPFCDASFNLCNQNCESSYNNCDSECVECFIAASVDPQSGPR